MSNHSPLCNKRVNCSIEQMARFSNHETGLFQATLHIPGIKKVVSNFRALLGSHSGYSQLCTSVTFQ